MVSPIKVYAPWDMTSDNAIVNLHDPTNQQDAATMGWAGAQPLWLSLNSGLVDPTFGDTCLSNPVDPRWVVSGTTLTVTGDGVKYTFNPGATAGGNKMVQPFVDAGQDFEIITHIENQANGQAMFGIIAADSTGKGVGLWIWNRDQPRTMLWQFNAWEYMDGQNSGNVYSNPQLTDYWLSLRRIGGTYYGRYALTGGSWVNLTTLPSSSFWGGSGPAIAWIGIGQLDVYDSTTAEIHLFTYGSPMVTIPKQGGGAAASQRTFQFFGG
jgi:hypothetical protein